MKEIKELEKEIGHPVNVTLEIPPMPNDVRERIRTIIAKDWEEQIGKLIIKPNIQPMHGTCCTCQVCGYGYDDCNCRVREAIKQIDDEVTAILSVIGEEIEGMKKILHDGTVDAGGELQICECDECYDIFKYNQAIDDIIKKLGGI